VLIIKINEIRALQNDALKEKLNELMLELFTEKRKIASTGVQSKVVKIREMRRTVARIKTVFRERGVMS
jgi:large subunit ribosomal protein L29